MPRYRPAPLLKRLGSRIRARRHYVGRTQKYVAESCGISEQMLLRYETGTGHPPAGTLQRLALALGTTSSSLLGETLTDTANEELAHFTALYAHPTIGAVVRYMQDMTAPNRASLQTIAAALAGRPKPVDKVEIMR